jgi:pimeloyl-ACP methyl ester carboxylesterase
MHVLAIANEKVNGRVLSKQVELVASNPAIITLKDTGHWVMEERPKETLAALFKFL